LSTLLVLYICDALPPAALRDSIDVILARTVTTGAGVFVFTADSIRWSGSFGVADSAANHTVKTQTVFRAGSISKSIVATAVLLLVEDGLDLDLPVCELVPENEPDRRPVV
jgi:CubicO group peptidase (beta-lactamase class C family)